MLTNNTNNPSTPSSEPLNSSPENEISCNKRKRRPAGTPDPSAEVVSLSPHTLLESDRYVCDICNQGFQRDQNLQMHRRKHKVPWKLLKRETTFAKKRVFVCPEPSCLHHDPRHALGDLVGIKKHFRRKHSNQKQWICEKCAKGYAVQSDYKAHLKTCGTRGHLCDCGRVFSRVESFIEHQDACNNLGQQPNLTSPPSPPAPPCLSRTASIPCPSSDTNINHHQTPYLELQLLTTLTMENNLTIVDDHDHSTTQLQLSIGTEKEFANGGESLRIAMAEKVYAEESRKQAKREIELAEKEFANAKRIRQQAQAEIERARALKQEAVKNMNSITCHSCKVKFHVDDDVLIRPNYTFEETSYSSRENSSPMAGLSYISAALREWEVRKSCDEK